MHLHRPPIVVVVTAEGVAILFQVALEALRTQIILIHPDVVGVVQIKEPTKEWQCAAITGNTIDLFIFEGIEFCRYCNLAGLYIWHKLSTIGGTIIEHLALLKELRRSGRYPCNKEYRKYHAFQNSRHNYQTAQCQLYYICVRKSPKNRSYGQGHTYLVTHAMEYGRCERGVHLRPI